MKVEKIGEGEPEYTVVGSLHGDEPCGKKAIEKFLSGDWELKKPVQFIIANEEAHEQEVRYLDTDLNRSFPGDPVSDSHEERLAARLLELVKGTKLIDFHSTRSQDEPFATTSIMTEEVLELARSSGVRDVAYFGAESGVLNERVPAVTVEAGRQGTEQAAENAYGILVNFLAAEGVIDADYERSDIELYIYYDTVEGGDLEFVAENFTLVEEGEVYARKDGEEIRADEYFFPILMSTHGYEDILGYKAQKIDKDVYL
ncbi:MAG: succinylglutamate desuccinylase/aspartoacylase family protein [Candidatus Nanohaloarchaea archaeon]